MGEVGYLWSAVARWGAGCVLPEPLIAYLRASPGTAVRIEGYTDNAGSEERNVYHSLDRAQAVARALLVSTSTINHVEAFGLGQRLPLASNATPSGRQQNRRVEITLQER